ncbi:MAG TPA: polysaccharide deacetylase family protein [Candidatus Peribacteraceae bacterium]|nr:polysaccharide deacetylase family protein [Candidatus Peribacteraceae bacterium]
MATLRVPAVLLCTSFVVLAGCTHQQPVAWQGSDEMTKPISMLPDTPVHSAVPLAQKAVSLVTPKAYAAHSGSTLGRRSFRVPILMYHYIRPMPGPRDKLGQGLTVTPETFAKQLDILQRKGYQTISFETLADTGSVLPPKPIIISFDDGYQDAYDAAFPALLKHHFTATFFIISGFVGKPNFATWDELRNMSGSGMDIEAHTVSHLNLSSLSHAQQEHEIKDSIAAIDDALHIHVLALAYPAGRYNADSMKICREAGMKFAVTTHLGVATDKYNTMELPRVRISEKSDFERIF